MNLDEAKDKAIKELQERLGELFRENGVWSDDVEKLERKVAGLEAVNKRLVEAAEMFAYWVGQSNSNPYSGICWCGKDPHDNKCKSQIEWGAKLTRALLAAKSPTKTLDEMLARERDKAGVCGEIQEIMEDYRAQDESPDGFGTPGGLEHMGDVWKLLSRWDRAISAKASPKAAGDE